ncbi:hypothetical protein SAMN02745753_04440 [Marinomonas polaris DSM 16579]|uniref:Membrane protein involved in the export of O-antigen and teichoic acid n=1 Tax=Marinomonas polaris DSM 16579 TaxID=1122206 RepID=A0A1M5MD72_9GAMM|nr:hypothetical protein [Marinomonas polaris]SHG75142.1 hypothetical protein SAMN02745753_04440 [Marinomonas polaris DSM 16579]
MSFRNSAIWTILCNLFVSVINILGIKILSQLYSMDLYGQELYLYSNSIIIGSILGLGMGQIINQSQSSNDKYKDTIYKVILKTVGIFFVISYIFSFQYFDIILKYIGVSFKQFNVAVLILILYTFDNLNRSFLIGRKLIKQVSLSLLVFTFMGWLFICLMYLFGIENFYLYGMLFIAVSNLIFTSYLVNSSLLSIEVFDTQKYKFLFFGKVLPALTSQFLGSIPQIVISTQLIVFYSPQSVAIYIVSMYIFRAMLFVPSGVQRVMLPYLGEVNNEKKINIIIKNMILNLVISLPFIFIIFFADEKISALFGFDYSSARNIFLYTVIAGGIASFVAPIGQLIISLDKYYISFLMNFFWSIIYIYISYFFMSNGFHIEFIMLSLFVSYFIHAAFGVLLLIKVRNETSH